MTKMVLFRAETHTNLFPTFTECSRLDRGRMFFIHIEYNHLT